MALSNEAKALGLRRGDPLFKVKEIVDAAVFTFYQETTDYTATSKAPVMATIMASWSPATLCVFNRRGIFIDMGAFLSKNYRR